MLGRKAKSGKSTTVRDGDGASVAKAVAALRAFVDGQQAWGVRELANALGQPGSSVHRLLQILRKDGLVEWDPVNQKYRSGMELFRWSAILSRRFQLADVARPIMVDLAATLGESCWLGIYEPIRNAHAYVFEVLASRPLNYAARLAQYEPLDKSAAGAAIMAFLPEGGRGKGAGGARRTRQSASKNVIDAELRRIRIDGYAVRPSADEDAPVTIAAPVFGARDVPAASLTLAVPLHRCPPDKVRELGAAVARAAGRLSYRIGSQVVGAAGAGAWHQGLNAIARLLQRDVADITTNAATRGGDGALRQLQAGQGAYCFAVADSLAEAFRGKPPFRRPHDRLRAMFSIFPLYLHIAVKRESPIKTFADLKRGRISAGDRDFTTARVVSRLLQLAGLAATPAAAERRLVFLDYLEAHREFLDDKLEAVISLTALDDPSYRELARRSDIRLLPLDRRLVEAFAAEHPTYEAAVIPGSTYPGCDVVTRTIMAPTVMATTIDRSDEEVYEVTRTIYENRKELASAVSGFNASGSSFIFRGITIPLHPAAKRFWREKGLIDSCEAS